ncbi:hypothetical protein GCM10009837_07290 [Streptomyces durmitorensis]|uniref:Uncharacterized protein n=1 Tax=Streptomyces durmitorensis TaxID=319947 RepID=A0ABY4PM54_9ACTN|nr:hypothetical protein [Streptomyces durmitorensis]UQT54379.1 hypothetical protein M4V62_04350 [Streptomyces durmitorensis]
MRPLYWLLLAALLLIAGMWPQTAEVTLGLMADGANAILAQIPTTVLLLAGVGYLALRRRTT